MTHDSTSSLRVQIAGGGISGLCLAHGLKAIHAVLPTLGKGANMAMRNAAALRDRLVAAATGQRPLLEAIEAYEQGMRDATYPIMELAADLGRFGAGGLRREPVEEVQA